MQKKFVTNLALLLFLNLLIKPYWILGIDRQVQKAVGTENFGVYFALFNFTFLLNILLDLGITQFNNKNIAQNNHLLTKHFSSLFVLKLLLAVVYIIVTLIAGFFVGYDLKYIKLVVILGFNQFLIYLILYLRSNIAGLHFFKTDSVISILDRSIMIIICLVLLYGHVIDGPLDIMHYVYAQTAAYLLTALIAFLIVVRKAEFLRLKLSLPFALMILRKSFPYAILVLLMTFYNRIDGVMLERMLPDPQGKQQAGLYAQGYRLLDATNMIGFLFSGLLLPIFSRMLKYKESVEQLVKLSYTLLITPAIIIAVGCLFYRNELMNMLYFDKNHPAESLADISTSAPVFALLMCCFMAISTTYIFGTLLTANGNMKELNLMAASGMLINIILNVVLIPRFFAFGSAISSLVTQSLMAFIQVLMVQYYFRFRINFRFLLQLFLFGLGVIVINYASRSFHFDEQHWMLNFAGMVGASGLWAFAIRLISIKAMMRIMKYG
ncbi:MAG TPA: oligosaccharide flippase family protein [Bacteroidia bacterium]|jgi:O-antigen/teichoic acid export membrane protein